MRTLILGLGNPIARDDAVGLLVARAVHARLGSPQVDLCEASVAGLGVLDLIAGYDRVVVVDAIQTAGSIPGQLHRFPADALIPTSRLASPHDVDFALALHLGRRLESALPAEFIVYAVEVEDPWTFDEHLTPTLSACLPTVIEAVLADLEASAVGAEAKGGLA